MTCARTAIVVACILGWPLEAAAQWPRPRVVLPPPSPEVLQLAKTPPATEIGIHIGLWNFMGSESFGVRVSRNVNANIAWEGSIEQGRWMPGEPRYGLAFGNVRVQKRTPEDRGWVFVSIGAGAGPGLTYDGISPMLSAGYQSDWHTGIMALRIEFQHFMQGTELRDRGRLLLGLAIAVR